MSSLFNRPTSSNHARAFTGARRGWVSALALLALVALLRAATGSFAWSAIPPGNEWLRAAVFLLAALQLGLERREPRAA